MKLLKKIGFPLLAIIILLALLLAVLILMYEQNGLFLPFASHPDNAETENAECTPRVPETTNNTLSVNWRII